MRKLIQSTVTGLVMLLATAALQAGSVTLLWDYDFAANPDVNLFKVYAVPGTNVTWQAGNTNATRTTTFSYSGSGSVSNILFGWGGFSSGPWTFTVTALGANGLESDNATTTGGTNVWAVLRPGKATLFKVNVP